MGNCKGQNPLEEDIWKQIDSNIYYVTMVNQQSQIRQKWISPHQENFHIYQWRFEDFNASLPQIQQYGSLENNSHGFIITKPYQNISIIHNIQDSYYLLNSIIEGLRILWGRFGGFQIQSKMIYIGCQGEPVIWVNSNLAINKPQRPKKNLTEKQIINQLMDTIQKKLNCNQLLNFPKKINTFNEAKKWIKNNLKHISIRKKYQQPNEISQSTSTSNLITIPTNSTHRQCPLKETKNLKKLWNTQEKSKDSKIISERDPDELLMELIQAYKL